jgi:hypothetical protein
MSGTKTTEQVVRDELREVEVQLWPHRSWKGLWMFTSADWHVLAMEVLFITLEVVKGLSIISLEKKTEQFFMTLPFLRMVHREPAKPSFSKISPGLCSSIFSNIEYLPKYRNVHCTWSNREGWAKQKTKSLLW